LNQTARSKTRVKYLVIGGYAVAYHGHVRYTGDLDIFVELSTDNEERIVRLSVNSASICRKPELFLRKGKIVHMGHEPMRQETLNEIDGVSFGEWYRQRRIARFDDLKTNFIDLPQLLKNKCASRRPQDLADIAALTSKLPRKKARH
jgi:hypothetical protein